MGKYKVIDLLTSLSTGQYVFPGEIVELEDNAAAILLERGSIVPAVAEVKSTETKKEKEKEKEKEEM